MVGVLMLTGALLGMAGCNLQHRANSLKKALNSAPVCCASPREFPFEPAALEQRIAFSIDERSPVFAFPTGRSFFKGFALPSSPRPAMATIVSYAEVEKGPLNQWTGSYFSPMVVTFDENRLPSRPIEGVRRFLFDGMGRRFSVLQVPVAPDARFMAIHTDAGLMDTTIAVPVEFAAQGTNALTCGATGGGTIGGQTDLEPMARALCGLFAGAPVYAPPATSEWNASIPYTAGGELELWLSAPRAPVDSPAVTR